MSGEQRVIGFVVAIVILWVILKAIAAIWRGLTRTSRAIRAHGPSVAEAAAGSAARVAGTVAGKAANAADQARSAYKAARRETPPK